MANDMTIKAGSIVKKIRMMLIGINMVRLKNWGMGLIEVAKSCLHTRLSTGQLNKREEVMGRWDSWNMECNTVTKVHTV